MNALPWYLILVIELVKLLPAVITAIKNDPNPSNKESTRVIVDNLKSTLSK